jgi:hypothetical protein
MTVHLSENSMVCRLLEVHQKKNETNISRHVHSFRLHRNLDRPLTAYVIILYACNNEHCLLLLLLFLSWRIRFSGLLPFRISSEILNFTDSRRDSLDRRSAHRKAATYTGQHRLRINVDGHPSREWNSNPRPQSLSGRCLEWDSKPRSQCLSKRRHFMLWTARPLSQSSYLQELGNSCQQWPQNPLSSISLSFLVYLAQQL